MEPWRGNVGECFAVVHVGGVAAVDHVRVTVAIFRAVLLKGQNIPLYFQQFLMKIYECSSKTPFTGSQTLLQIQEIHKSGQGPPQQGPLFF